MNELEATVGGLSTPSKMPGWSYGIPAKDCLVGALLRQVKGSTCSKCYALKGMYVFPCVKNAQQKRLDILRKDLPGWTSNMVELLSRKYARKSGPDAVFRWHDAGDLQSFEHLSAIVAIAKALPSVKFWLPTREYGIIQNWKRSYGSFPHNLIVRLSAAMIGRKATKVAGVLSSTVGYGQGYACPAYKQGGQCGDCRACWNPRVESVDYPQH